jgi:hypothetical protein
MENVAVKSHRERPIPPGSVRQLYDHVGWRRPGSEEDIAKVLEAGPAVGAWDGERLVGFVRALPDGRFACQQGVESERKGVCVSGIAPRSCHVRQHVHHEFIAPIKMVQASYDRKRSAAWFGHRASDGSCG